MFLSDDTEFISFEWVVMINTSIGLTESCFFFKQIMNMLTVFNYSTFYIIHQNLLSPFKQRKLSIGTNSDPETTLDTTAVSESDKTEKKKKKKRKKDLEAGEEVATEETPAAEDAGDDEASKKEKKKKKKKEKNKDKSDE